MPTTTQIELRFINHERKKFYPLLQLNCLEDDPHPPPFRLFILPYYYYYYYLLLLTKYVGMLLIWLLVGFR